MDIPVNAAKPGRRRYLTLVMIFITVVICYVDRANGRGFRPYSGRVRHYQSGNGLYFRPSPGFIRYVRSPAVGF